MASKTTKAVVSILYPKVAALMSKNLNKYKLCIGRFIEKRHQELYAIGPFDRIFFGDEDVQDLYSSIGITEAEIMPAIQKTYYWDIASFNPRCVKDGCTILMLCIIKYFHNKKMNKELELSIIHLSFSGKFYPSIHFSSYPKVTPREHPHIMEYVVNNMLTNKFDLKIHGNVIGAIRSIGITWVTGYDTMIKSFDDEDIVYIAQQLHCRIKSFTQNIAELYYDCYNNKENYMTYDSDNLDDNSYRLADNDSLKSERVVEKTIETINNTSVDYKLCKMSSDSNIKTDEIKTIIETITTNNDSADEVKELIRLLTITYFESSQTKDVRDIEFITFSIAAKPNTKDKNILREKEIVEGWLDENSPSYRKRKSRLATRSSYNKAIFTYFTLLIHTSNK